MFSFAHCSSQIFCLSSLFIYWIHYILFLSMRPLHQCRVLSCPAVVIKHFYFSSVFVFRHLIAEYKNSVQFLKAIWRKIEFFFLYYLQCCYCIPGPWFHSTPNVPQFIVWTIELKYAISLSIRKHIHQRRQFGLPKAKKLA